MSSLGRAPLHRLDHSADETVGWAPDFALPEAPRESGSDLLRRLYGLGGKSSGGRCGPLPHPVPADHHRRGNRVVRPLLFVIIGVLLADHACGQEQGAQRADDAAARNVLVAGAIEWIVPVLGHAYAGDAKRGMRPLLVSFGGLAAGFTACAIGTAVGEGSCFMTEGWSNQVFGLGVITFVAGRVWGVVSAVNTARRFNASLKERPGIKNARAGLSVNQVGQITMGIVIPF